MSEIGKRRRERQERESTRMQKCGKGKRGSDIITKLYMQGKDYTQQITVQCI